MLGCPNASLKTERDLRSCEERTRTLGHDLVYLNDAAQVSHEKPDTKFH